MSSDPGQDTHGEAHGAPAVIVATGSLRTDVYTLMGVAVRVAALFFALGAVVEGIAFVSMAAVERMIDETVGIQLGFAALQVVLFGLVWLFADILVRAALGRPQGRVFESDLDAGAWRVIAFSTIGLWFVASGLAELVDHLMVGWWWLRQEHSVDVDGMPMVYRGLVVALAKCAIGASLLLGSRGLVRLLDRLRGHATASTAPDAGQV